MIGIGHTILLLYVIAFPATLSPICAHATAWLQEAEEWAVAHSMECQQPKPLYGPQTVSLQLYSFTRPSCNYVSQAFIVLKI